MPLHDYLMPNYKRLPITFKRGEGAWLYDTEGEKYLDAISGIAVCSLGHAHPEVTAAICNQTEKLLHTSNLYQIEKQQQLGAKLAEVSGLDSVFFCNSGAEANEAAIKLTRLHAHNEYQFKTPLIAVMKNAFHGRTMATISASRPFESSAFAPLLPGFVQVDFGDVEQLRALPSQYPELCAVMLEPIQGEAGVVIPPSGYLTQVREFCDKHKLLLVIDEVQTGIARTGQWFCFQHENIIPDIISVAKALGNGMPIGACIAKKEVANHLVAGTHGSTFGGNPLACAAGLAVINTIEKEHLIHQATTIGNHLITNLRKSLPKDAVKDIRGQGLMIGIELSDQWPHLPQPALEKNLLINMPSPDTIRLLPPLLLAKNQADSIIEILTEILRAK